MASLLRRIGHRLSLIRRARSYFKLRQARRTGTYAQHGEDTYVREALGSDGFYVDIGANDPHILSNTYGLYLAGWRGITVEPIKSLVGDHRRTRARDIQVHAGIGAADGQALPFIELSPRVLSTFDQETADTYIERGLATLIAKYHVEVRSVSSVLTEHGVGAVDLLSIDVKGLELQVLKGLDFSRHAPRMIIVETASAAGENPTAHEVRAFLCDNGYKKIDRLGVNDVYVLT